MAVWLRSLTSKHLSLKAVDWISNRDFGFCNVRKLSSLLIAGSTQVHEVKHRGEAEVSSTSKA
jgi:hypothetical protein